MAKPTNSEIFSKTLSSILVSKNRDDIIELSESEGALTPFIVCRMLSYKDEFSNNENCYNMLASVASSGLPTKTINLLLANSLCKTKSGFCKKW